MTTGQGPLLEQQDVGPLVCVVIGVFLLLGCILVLRDESGCLFRNIWDLHQKGLVRLHMASVIMSLVSAFICIKLRLAPLAKACS